MLRHHRGSKNKNIIQNLPFSDDPHFPEWTHNSWLEIWQQDLNRVYSADFEIYGEKAQNPQDVEVEILVAINE
ncbi:MAG: putative transcriptional regulator YdeE [Saprospiraceae bacterium]|jgi:predicted transcriptional regulator YdeE